ncbi:MAG: helix-hairpin-helix domain-containing protein [Flavobacteriales bacterium]
MNFKENFIELFAFTRGERKGILIVLILLGGLITYRYCAPFLENQSTDHLLPMKDKIAAWSSQLEKDSSNFESFTYNSTEDKAIVAGKPFPFNPNSTSDDAWKQLGLNRGQIKSINNFLQKGGTFKVKKDFAKMFVISAEEYERLQPYILLPNEMNFSDSHTKTYEQHEFYPKKNQKDVHLILEINSADSFDFRKLKGIGPYLSRKIVSYREKLGGFYSVDQLKEVYHMDPLRIDSLRFQMLTDTSLIQRIHINRIEVAELMGHPYLNKQQARALIAYRDQHGPFKSVSDIRKSVLIDEKTYQKIAPYLTVD